MKNLFFLSIAALISVVTSAQKVYFLYLQSDDQAPFYVRMADKIHSSASSGFLIVPNLTDGTYTFGLGFAKSSASEAKFSVTINDNDKGYIIKNFEDGLSLFDFQDLSVVKSNTVQKDNSAYETKTDNFSSVLSKAASDPSLLKVPVAKKQKEDITKVNSVEKESATVKVEERKREEKSVENSVSNQPATKAKEVVAKTEVDKMDTTTAQQTQPQVIVPTSSVTGIETKSQINTYKPSVINRYTESSTTEGFGVVYLDNSGGAVDTIRILIPASKVRLTAATENTTANEEITKNDASNVPAEVKKMASNTETLVSRSDKPIKVSSVCKSIASDKDFMKLRKRMAAEESDDEMINEARKEFKNKCYSVEQVRYLSTLFLTSAAKYQFFDATYEHVSDKNNFHSLGAEIKDEHYSKRFKALIGE